VRMVGAHTPCGRSARARAFRSSALCLRFYLSCRLLVCEVLSRAERNGRKTRVSASEVGMASNFMPFEADGKYNRVFDMADEGAEGAPLARAFS
jgi:hypothetical protein